jgi:hypothetical protein
MAATELRNVLALLATAELPELGPGPRAGVESETALNGKLQDILSKSKLPPLNQELIRALVLLWHDHLDAAHVISQEIETSDGSLVHGIVHRREPDYSNAKYWFRRVGKHPAFAKIAERVAARLEESKSAGRSAPFTRNGEWDACAFVDACETASARGESHPEYETARQVQRIETETLVESFCSNLLR